MPARGTGLLQSALYIAVACVLAALLLLRLLALSEAAEKAAVDATLLRVQAALYVRLAQSMVAGASGTGGDWQNGNPFVLAGAVPANYAGELPAPDLRGLSGGQWHYDTIRKEMVYLLRQSRSFTGDGSQPPRLRFRLEVTASPGGAARSLALRPVSAYVWEP